MFLRSVCPFSRSIDGQFPWKRRERVYVTILQYGTTFFHSRESTRIEFFFQIWQELEELVFCL